MHSAVKGGRPGLKADVLCRPQSGGVSKQGIYFLVACVPLSRLVALDGWSTSVCEFVMIRFTAYANDRSKEGNVGKEIRFAILLPMYLP
jgi:hypothetical protein